MDANKVSVSKPKAAGVVYQAPAGTTLPADATTALANTYVELGYVSEDGITNSIERDSDNIKAFGGDVVAAVGGGKTDTFAMTLIESMNVNTLKAVYGSANVTGTLSGTGGIKTTVNNAADVACVWVIDLLLKDNASKRIVIPNGVITEQGETVYKDDETIGYEITITAMADSTAAHATHYEYTYQAATPGSGG